MPLKTKAIPRFPGAGGRRVRLILSDTSNIHNSLLPVRRNATSKNSKSQRACRMALRQKPFPQVQELSQSADSSDEFNPAMSHGLHHVYAHICHSVLYVLWALLYLYLVFIQQPILFFIIRTIDRLSNYWPFRGTRETIIAFLKLLLARVSPSLARHFLSYTPFGKYSGNDRELFPGEKKRFPLHSVSLNGCAWMLPYHIGVCEVLKTYGMVDENTIWLGSSGGALIATAAALDLDLEHQLKFCISMGIESSEAHTLGPVANMSRYIAPHVMTSLPENAHLNASGKLYISVTETPQASSIFGNKLVNEFKSKRHIYHTLMASTYIPLYYERPVRPGMGAFYWDGGFSNNQPVLYGSDGRCLTTTVSPMARKADISPPRQTTCNIEHLFPGGYGKAMDVYFNGRQDALTYVRKMHDKFGFALAKPLTGDENVRRK